MFSEIYAYDPILLRKVEINTWLSETPDNIIILVDYNENTDIKPLSQFESKKLNIFALNKNYIQNVNIRDIFLKCLLINEQFLPFTTYKSRTGFYNLGFYFNRNILINLNEVNPSKLKGQFFNLSLSNNTEQYINKEFLLLSNIGIEQPINIKNSLHNLTVEEKETLEIEHENRIIQIRNLPYNKDVYFERLLAEALTEYSYKWDAPINTFLRTDIGYFDSTLFAYYFIRYGITKEEAKQAVIDKIADLDRVFIEAAPRNENSDKFYWRGMKEKFSGLDKVGDKIVVNGFTSLSLTYNIAKKFSGIKTKSGCCIYKLLLDKGIPYIDMVNTTKFKDEDEILLPRGLVFEFIDIIQNKAQPNTMLIRVSMSKTNIEEFKINTGCREFILGKLEPIKKTSAFFKNVKTKSNSVKEKKEMDYIETMNAMGSLNISDNVDKFNDKVPSVNNDKVPSVNNDKVPSVNNDKVPSVKQSRCLKGTRRNKLTGLCEPYNKDTKNKLPKGNTQKQKQSPHSSNRSKSSSGSDQKKTKKKKCPSGSRRSKKTGLCEPYTKKK
jgi:hypothetical protein